MAFLINSSSAGPFSPADNSAKARLTNSARPVSDCPEPCACYDEGYSPGREPDRPGLRPCSASCSCEPCTMGFEVATGQDPSVVIRVSPMR